MTLLSDFDYPRPVKGVDVHFFDGELDGVGRSLPSLGRYYFGRNVGCDVVFPLMAVKEGEKTPPEAFVSEVHACLTVERQGLFISNNHATNGLWILEADIDIEDDCRYELPDAAIVRLGKGGPRLLIRYGDLSELGDADVYRDVPLDPGADDCRERTPEEEKRFSRLLYELWNSGEPRDKVRNFIIRYYSPCIRDAILRSGRSEKLEDCAVDAVTDFSAPGLMRENAFWLQSYDPGKGTVPAYLAGYLNHYRSRWMARDGMPERPNTAWRRMVNADDIDAAACLTSPSAAVIMGSRADKYHFTAAAGEARRRECESAGDMIQYQVFQAVSAVGMNGKAPAAAEVAERFGMPRNTVNTHVSRFLKRVRELFWWGAWMRINDLREIRKSLELRKGSAESRRNEEKKDRHADRMFERWEAVLPACRAEGGLPGPPKIPEKEFVELFFGKR